MMSVLFLAFEEDEQPILRAFTTQSSLLCHQCLFFTAGTSVSHKKAVKHVLLYGEQRSYQLVLMLSAPITPLSQPLDL